MTRAYVLGAVVGLALLVSAALLWLHEPGPAEGPYRARVACRAVCGEAGR